MISYNIEAQATMVDAYAAEPLLISRGSKTHASNWQERQLGNAVSGESRQI